MNTKRILSWGSFIIVIGLIIWGMIAAANKAEKINNNVAPVDKVTSEDWVRGSASSTVTIVEYSDFQCPACGLYFPIVEELYTKYNTHYQFVYRHFPLSQHLNAIPAAQAAEAAGIQGKFWEMYSMIFENQKSWENQSIPKPVFIDYANKLGLDVDKFATDYELPEIKAKIESHVKSGLKAGVNSTPTFYLNGKKINAQSYEQFKTLIDEATATTTAS